MLKKKKKKRVVKEKKVRKKCLDERESLSYEQQILDNNRLLSQYVYDRVYDRFSTLSAAFLIVTFAMSFKGYAAGTRSSRSS